LNKINKMIMSIKNKIINLFYQIKSHLSLAAIANFFAKHKKLVFTSFAGLIVALILWFIFDIYRKNAQEKYSEIFHQSLIDEEKGDISQARKNLQKIYEAKFTPSGVKGLASIRYAAFLFNENNRDEALKVYLEIAKNSRYDHYLRELSGLMASKILVININENSDKESKEKGLAQILNFEDKSKILHYYFSEQSAIFAMKIGDLEKSYKISEEIIKSQQSPQGLKTRAYDMIKLLAEKGYVAPKSDIKK